MSKPIDELVIQIKADTKQLKKELKQVQGKLKTTGVAGGAAFGGMAGAMSKAKVGAVALTAALVAVGATFLKIGRIGSEFEDLKDSLDTVFGSMKAGDEAMQRVFKFAQTTPFQIETATKAFIALQSAGVEPTNRMLQVFADTASTSTDQLGVFEALVRTVQRSASGGLGLEELNMIMDRGIDVLGILNDELGLSKDEIAKFGASAEGAKLITDALINGLEKKFGGAMESKMDNLSTKSSNMKIAFKQLSDEVFKSGLGNFLKGMADSLTNMADSIVRARQVARGEAIGIDFVTPEFSPREDVMLQRTVASEAENINRITERRNKLMQENINLNDVLDKYFPRGTEQRRKLDEGIDKSSTHYTNLRKEIAFNIAEMKLLSDAELDIIAIQRIREQSNKKLSDDEKASIKRKGELLNSATFLANEISKLKGNTDELSFASENLNEIFENNKKLFKDLRIESVEELQIYMDKLTESTNNVTDAVDNLNDTVEPVKDVLGEELKQAVISTSNAFTTDFVNSLLDGESALDSFKSFARNIVSQIIAIFLQLAVVNKLINDIFGLTGDDALNTIDIGGSKPKFDTGSWDGNMGGLGGAGGGSMFGGQPRLVGERGAEIFVPHTSGTLLNNMNSKNAMGSGKSVNIYQTVNFATGIVPTVRAEVTKMMPQIADVTKVAVQESAMRGGNFRRSLVGG